MSAEPLTKEELQAIEARLKAATPGPWVDVGYGRIAVGDETGRTIHAWIWDNIESGDQDQADGTFIANAPTDIARLLAEVRRLRVIASDTDPVLRRRIEALEAGAGQSRLVWESQIKGVEGQRDDARVEIERLKADTSRLREAIEKIAHQFGGQSVEKDIAKRVLAGGKP